MLYKAPILALLALQVALAAPVIARPLHRRQSPSALCNTSIISPPTNSTGWAVPDGQQVVAVALARGLQNYTCTFSQQLETGVLALLFDITCLVADFPPFESTSENSTSSSSISTSAVGSSTSPPLTSIASAISTTSPTGPTVTAATATDPSAVVRIPIDGLPPPLVLPDPATPSSVIFTLSDFAALSLSVPFPYNASTFPYSSDDASFPGEWYFVLPSPSASTNSTAPVPYFSLPGYSAVVANETSRIVAPEGQSGGVDGGGMNGTNSLDWAMYEALGGGNGMFARTVWRTDTAGGAVDRNCTGEGSMSAVDFASILYFFR